MRRTWPRQSLLSLKPWTPSTRWCIIYFPQNTSNLKGNFLATCNMNSLWYFFVVFIASFFMKTSTSSDQCVSGCHGSTQSPPPSVVECLRTRVGRRRRPSWARLGCHHVNHLCLINANLTCLGLDPGPAHHRSSIHITIRLLSEYDHSVKYQGCPSDAQALTTNSENIVIKKF